MKLAAHESLAKNVVESDDKILILVLHVDDETGFLESTKQILEMTAPLHVYAAASVAEAKEILETKKVKVLS
jgi:DNA-binding NtrC family response regulator